MNCRLIISLIVFCALVSSTALGSLGGTQSAVDTSMPALGSDVGLSTGATSTGAQAYSQQVYPEQDMLSGQYDSSSAARIAQSAPPASQQQKLVAYDLNTERPSSVYYSGRSLAWSAFSSSYLGSSPVFWVDTASGWSWYATLPLGGWMRELMYIPASGSLRVYEIYPSGATATYNLGTANPGFNYIWFYGDTSGRHISLFTINGVASNAVIIDVFPAQSYPIENPIYVPVVPTYPSGYYYGYGYGSTSGISTGSQSSGSQVPPVTTPGGQPPQGTVPATSNSAPRIVSFGPEVPNPPGIGPNNVRFVTDARDADGDTIYFRYLLNGPDTGGAWKDQSSWIPDKYWLLRKTAYKPGNYQIQVQVRDKNHAGENSYDDSRTVSYTI